MISCTEFIMAYSELFKFLHERHGHEAVVKFWEGISDEFLWNLRDLVKAKGIQGMKEYWGHTLTEEGADCTVEATADTFTIHMHCCPSVGILRRATHMERYPDYCKHCDTLYRRIMEPLGFSYEIQYLDEQAGHCGVTIRTLRDGKSKSQAPNAK